MDNNASEKKDLSEERLIEEFPATELTDNNADSLTTDIEDEQSPIPGGKQPHKRGGKWVWVGVLVFVLFIAAGVFFGYRNGVQLRLANEKALLMEQISLQLE